MSTTHVKTILFSMLMMLWCAGLCVADTVVLKDGTKIVGSVMKSGDRLYVDPDNGGKARFIDMTDVKDWIKSPSTATPTPTSGTGAGVTAPQATSVSAMYNVAKAKANALIYPTDAIKVWKDFLATKPAPNDFDKHSAEGEIADLTKLQESGSERMGSKWITGVERKKLASDARDVFKEAMTLLEADKTLQAIPKLQEALKIYPNYYSANCYMAVITYYQDKQTDAMNFVKMCLKLRPNSIDALNNYGVLMAKQNQYDQAIAKFYEAIQVEDDIILAYNLAHALALDSNKSSSAILKATEASKLLASKYHIPDRPQGEWAKIRFFMHDPAAPQRPTEGMLVSGSGFVLNEEGYILTNRHVVNKMTSFLIITSDSKSMPADLVTIDKDRDLALLKIRKMDAGVTLTPVIISKTDYPAVGQQCFAMGYPLMDVLGATLKITQGIVSGKAVAENGVDVLVDAKVNPGNSGGPLLDKYGQVIGIITMKTLSDTTEDSYGMAISGGTLKKFLAENNIKVASKDGGSPLQPEEVVAKVRSGTVCILAHDGPSISATQPGKP